jgi:glucose/arabinose dehydrogenase
MNYRFFLISLIVLALTGCGIAQQQQITAARQQHSEAMKQANAEPKAAMLECKSKRLAGELVTHVSSVQCSNPRVIDAYERAGYSYMDLIRVMTAKRLEVAEEQDRGQSTEGQAELEIAEAASRITEEERRRNLEAADVNLRYSREAARRAEVNRQEGVQMMQSGLDMMSRGQSTGGRVICNNNPMASGTMPNPVICQNF